MLGLIVGNALAPVPGFGTTGRTTGGVGGGVGVGLGGGVGLVVDGGLNGR
jgi:hypothetical protein